MRRDRVCSSILIVMATFLMTVSPATVQAVDTSDTRLLASPAITEGKIAFVYADDIWVADADGTGARRLTSHPGEEQNPYFSPDGKHIAFTASYDGNVDVYVVPVEGGEPTRLTWHPGEDIVRGFTPDGKVLFSSQRAVFSRRHSQFFTVGVDGGRPAGAAGPDRRYGGDLARRQLPGLHAARRAVPPVEELSRRHGLADLGPQARLTCRTKRSPSPPAAATTPQPMWIGETVYFLSDRDGEFNLYSYDRNSRNVVRRTEHEGFPIASASAGAGRIIYEQAGCLHLFDPSTNESPRLKIGVAADLAETRPRYVSDAKHDPLSRGSRPPASGRCSSTAARSSPFRPRRETRAT